MLCYHGGMDNYERPKPTEMYVTAPHRYLCRTCGNVWDCHVHGHPSGEHPDPPKTPEMSPGLKAEIEAI